MKLRLGKTSKGLTIDAPRNLAHIVEQWTDHWLQIKIFVKAVAWIDAHLDPTPFDQTVNKIGNGGRRQFKRSREFRLRHAFISAQIQQHTPLGSGQSQPTTLAVEARSELPRKIAYKSTNAPGLGFYRPCGFLFCHISVIY